ncbi:MAG: GntR family transcriptional regulator [Candidatus Stygibacter australis]|nr:GntR family transcriptional regulator [Candidatus Stygibacter australis]MDP8323459.1 GntR family transcriptional regulator [Candidatus Stygibacter australis]
MRNFDPNVPLFLQVKEDIENMILSGAVQEDEKLPSVREMARDYELNPNTVNSAIGELLNADIIYKKRGIGMFVKQGVKDKLLEQRLESFETEEVETLVQRARMLGMSEVKLVSLISSRYRRED